VHITYNVVWLEPARNSPRGFISTNRQPSQILAMRRVRISLFLIDQQWVGTIHPSYTTSLNTSDFALRTFEANEADTLTGLNGKTRVYSSEVNAALLARALRHTDVKNLGVGITADPYSNPCSPFQASHLAVIIDSTDQSLTDESVNIVDEPLHWQVTPIVKGGPARVVEEAQFF
jgi:hypothetical protein